MSGAPLLATQNVTDLLSLTATRRQVPQRQTGDPVDIVKRDGRVERYDGEKIVSAVTRAFADGGAIAAREELAAILADVEARLEDGARVEEIQHLVEQALMRRGHFDVAKRYILYRHRRSELRAARDEVVREVAGDDAALASELSAVLSRARRDYPDEAYSQETQGKMTANFWYPVMKNGVITFSRPEDCPLHKPLREMEMKIFGKELDNFSGLSEFEGVI